MELKINPEWNAGSGKLEIIGEVDLYNANEFAQALLQLVTSCPRVIVDFTNVKYLDSSGVGALIRVLQKAKNSNCDIRFFGVQGMPRRVLEMSNVLALMKHHPAQGDVLAAWGVTK